MPVAVRDRPRCAAPSRRLARFPREDPAALEPGLLALQQVVDVVILVAVIDRGLQLDGHGNPRYSLLRLVDLQAIGAVAVQVEAVMGGREADSACRLGEAPVEQSLDLVIEMHVLDRAALHADEMVMV